MGKNVSDYTVVYDKNSVKKQLNKTDNKKKSKRNLKTFRRIWIIMVVLVSVLLIKYVLTGINDMLAISRDDTGEKVTIEIPEGSSTSDISNILCSAGVINDKSFFYLYSVLTKSSNKFTQGRYEMSFGMDYEAIVNYLKTQSNRTDTVDLTFQEGKTILEYAELLSENGVCKSDEFLKLCNSDEFDDNYDFLSEIKNSGEKYYKLEGYLYPDTYTFNKGEDPKKAIKRFLDNYEDKILSFGKKDGSKTNLKSLASEKDMTLDELTALASLIQSEAANKEDMYYISSVFHNRLSTLSTDGLNKFGEYSMNNLNSDVTVWYPYKNKESVPADKLSEFPGRYDTYSNKGMLKGSICNPGIDAFEAALNPKDTDYFYFCYNNDGDEFYLAKTMREHQNNLVKAELL